MQQQEKYKIRGEHEREAIMLAGNMGMGAYNKLAAHGISTVRGCHGNVNDVLTAYLNGTLTDSAESCNHHDCGNHDEKPVYVIS